MKTNRLAGAVALLALCLLPAATAEWHECSQQNPCNHGYRQGCESNAQVDVQVNCQYTSEDNCIEYGEDGVQKQACDTVVHYCRVNIDGYCELPAS